MSVTSGQFTLSTTPTVIVAKDAEFSRGARQVIIEAASATVYIGGSTVDSTGANGIPVATTDILTFMMGGSEELYAVATAGTPTLRVMVCDV